ncbi:PREDICTED: uncharacterized protein LOC104598815 isoform X2 [Nelumbo nucifera]|uniref:Uncharacterized protein LOC104598815 isoform X2 n=1 Tax=Nelumbo nucifera TaxID=4432 RepID=A0A1U7ZXU7_NELNU|nr:PREDICTED: uncharacterized protein LOC104598815 isoform X2 [Nelumbo nucifera]
MESVILFIPLFFCNVSQFVYYPISSFSSTLRPTPQAFLPSPHILLSPIHPPPDSFLTSPHSPFHLLIPIPTLSATRELEMANCNRGEGEKYLAYQQEEASQGKKYGLLPRKKPLISKDHERAFFDSADWALGKQTTGFNERSKAAVEMLRPKLQAK